jgi:hypothetical protein
VPEFRRRVRDETGQLVTRVNRHFKSLIKAGVVWAEQVSGDRVPARMPDVAEVQ